MNLVVTAKDGQKYYVPSDTEEIAKNAVERCGHPVTSVKIWEPPTSESENEHQSTVGPADRKKATMPRAGKGNTAVEEATEVHGDDELFPELNPDKPKEKELIKALKRYRDDKREHAEAVKGPKEQMDESERRAIGLMHELKLEKVKVDGEVFERRPGEESIKVKKAKKPRDEESED